MTNKLCTDLVVLNQLLNKFGSGLNLRGKSRVKKSKLTFILY